MGADPREIRGKSETPPVYVFTDGACEDETSIGGIIFCPGERPQAFGCVLRDEDLAEWKTKVGQSQIIGQAEIYPAWVAKLTFADKLAGRRAIFFIDNESAKIALIRAYSPVVASLRLVMQCAAWDYENQCGAWYARVPTCCNPADSPSRMEVSELMIRLGVELVKPILPFGRQPARYLK